MSNNQYQYEYQQRINAILYPQPPQPEPLNDGLTPPTPIFEPRVSQLPMNFPQEDASVETASTSSASASTSTSATTTDSVWSFESTRDIHEFLREVNGRRYNAQNTMYFLPAGQSVFQSISSSYITLTSIYYTIYI